jgi:hypothetical protein
LTTKLTDLAIRALPLGPQKDYPDGNGLVLRVGVKRRTWMLTIRENGRRRYETLGHYPSLSLSGARTRAKDRLAAIRLSPQETPTLRLSEGFEQFARLHLPNMRGGSRYECERVLRKYVLPALGAKPLATITTPQLAGILDRIDRPGERRNAFIWTRCFLSWAYGKGHLDGKPWERLKVAASRPRDRVLTDDELVKIWNACQGDYGVIVRLCIATAQRRGQFLHLRSDFIHADRIEWPRDFMKADMTHSIAVTPFITPLLEPYCCGLTLKHMSGNYKEYLDERCGVTNWTIHDLRRTGATGMARLGVQPHIIERTLAHHSGTISGVAAIYNRFHYDAECRDALILWQEYLAMIGCRNI